ncbi:MAG TPA: hypothetical protein VJQ59_16840 [Candidatus Sulfotelmatobacter sp.]|nr:hypothetical protein [Candidatus Sulfotelmatobacter sp.]
MSNPISTCDIERFLIGHGWKRAASLFGETAFEKNGDWRVEVEDDCISIRRFSDSDIQVQDVGAVATPRWVTESEWYSLDELRIELVWLEVHEWECPYCGESGGEPVTRTWREFQGVEGHGGVVIFEEEVCSKCYRPQRDLLGVAR